MSINADCAGANSGAMTKFAVAAARTPAGTIRVSDRSRGRAADPHSTGAGRGARPFSEWVMGMGHGAAVAVGPGCCPIMGRPNGERKV
jgi:hypothetical protein